VEPTGVGVRDWTGVSGITPCSVKQTVCGRRVIFMEACSADRVVGWSRSLFLQGEAASPATSRLGGNSQAEETVRLPVY